MIPLCPIWQEPQGGGIAWSQSGSLPVETQGPSKLCCFRVRLIPFRDLCATFCEASSVGIPHGTGPLTIDIVRPN